MRAMLPKMTFSDDAPALWFLNTGEWLKIGWLGRITKDPAVFSRLQHNARDGHKS